MINKVILLGRVGKDPEVKQFDNGSVANFTIATDDSYKDKSGQKIERTDWHNISVNFPGLVEVVSKYVKKGDLLFVISNKPIRINEKNTELAYQFLKDTYSGQANLIDELKLSLVPLIDDVISADT